MSKTIARNRKSLIQKIFKGAQKVTSFSLSGGFIGYELADHQALFKKFEEDNSYKLHYQGLSGDRHAYSIRVHSNLWYEFTSEVGP